MVRFPSQVPGWLKPSRRRLESYAVAIAAVAAVAIVREASDSFLGTTLSYTPFLLAVIVASWYGGTSAGLLSVALSLLVGNYLFADPRGSLTFTEAESTVRALFFAGSGALLAMVLGRAHWSVRRAEERDLQTLALRHMAEDVAILVRASDVEGLHVWFNRPWMQFTGEEADPNSLRLWMERMHPDDAVRARAAIDLGVESRAPYTVE
jgi:K+-sensing histidine kinase KdpD